MQQRKYFTDDFFKFLRDLKTNNNREWFLANKEKFERDVRNPTLQFISDFAPHLRKINKHYVADPKPHGGSLFRIYRDIRFSADKSPYKTHLGASFSHDRAMEGSAPVFYLHLEPNGCFAGAGLWHPDPRTLNKVRSSILNRTSEWKRVLSSGIKVGGDSLSRAPRGFPPDHPFIKDLMRKDFVSSVPFSNKQVQNSAFLLDFADACKSMSPLVHFLAKAVGLPW